MPMTATNGIFWDTPTPKQLDRSTAVQAYTESWAVNETVNETIVETQLPDVLVFPAAIADIEVD